MVGSSYYLPSYYLDDRHLLRVETAAALSCESGAHPSCHQPLPLTQPCVHVQLSNVKTLLKENKRLQMNFELIGVLLQANGCSDSAGHIAPGVRRLQRHRGRLRHRRPPRSGRW